MFISIPKEHSNNILTQEKKRMTVIHVEMLLEPETIPKKKSP